VSGDRPNELVDRAYQVGASAVATPDAAAAAAGVDRRGTIRALGIVPIVLLAVYTRPSVRATFERRAA